MRYNFGGESRLDDELAMCTVIEVPVSAGRVTGESVRVESENAVWRFLVFLLSTKI